MCNHTSRRILNVAIGAILATPTVASSAGFALLEQSASRLGTAFAGMAAADDATTVFFNPAGLLDFNRREALAIGSGIEITSEFRDQGSRNALGQPTGGDGGDAGDWNFVPGLYASLPVNDKVAFGLGINAPFGLKLEYEPGWVGRFQALNSEIETMNFNFAVAYRLTPGVMLGVGVNYQRIEAELTNAVNYTAVVAQGLQQFVAAGQLPPGAVPGLISANAGLEGTARVRGDDDAWGYNVGVMFDLTKSTELGISYRSSIGYRVEGTANFAPPTATQPVGAGIIAAVSAPGGALADGAVSVDLRVPDSALVSLQQGLGSKLNLLIDVAWTGWSSIQELRVVRDSGATLSVTPERWEDAWRFALGATYALSGTTTLRAGAAFDQTPVPDATRTPRLPDADRTWLAIGAQWQPTPALTFDVGYAYVLSKTVSLNQDAGNAAASGTLIGEQHSDIDILAAQVAYRF